jgi:hypothetical protein
MRFSAAIVRAQLGSLFRCVGGAIGGPLALVGRAPGEEQEIGPLMLALFLRRGGLRTAYVGQRVEPEGFRATVIRSRSHGTCAGDYSAHGDGYHL